jgi:hypothetical protein
VTAPSVKQDTFAAQPVGAPDRTLSADGDTGSVRPPFL